MDVQTQKFMWKTSLTNGENTDLGWLPMQTGANCVGPIPIAMELLRVHFSVKHMPANSGPFAEGAEQASWSNAHWSDLGFTPVNVSAGGNIQRSGGMITEAFVTRDNEFDTSGDTGLHWSERKRLATYKRSTVADAISGGTATRWVTRSREEGEWWDFTDGAGNGLIIASDKIHIGGMVTVWNMNSGVNAVVDLTALPNHAVRITVDLFYRMRAVTIQKFISACAD